MKVIVFYTDLLLLVAVMIIMVVAPAFSIDLCSVSAHVLFESLK
jgi:hypothetical protein